VIPKYQRVIKMVRWEKITILGYSICKIVVNTYSFFSYSLKTFLNGTKHGMYLLPSMHEIQSLEFYAKLRDFRNLKGQCGVCEYRETFGGCGTRAEAMEVF
jgi:MoaA/NifB/PqqE/SkfB family radical SAM enzyme